MFSMLLAYLKLGLLNQYVELKFSDYIPTSSVGSFCKLSDDSIHVIL
jgi:hypothetical protein